MAQTENLCNAHRCLACTTLGLAKHPLGCGSLFEPTDWRCHWELHTTKEMSLFTW